MFRKKRFFFLTTMSFLLVLFSSSVAFANSDQDSSPDKPTKRVITQKLLTPEKGSDTLKSVKIEEFSDGSIKKTFSGTVSPKEGPIGYSIKINKDTGTYSAKRLDLTNDPEYNRVQPRSEMWDKQVKLVTFDPIGIDVCYTKAILYWYTANDYAIYEKGGHAAWAANPTPQPFNTHWYVDSIYSFREDDNARTAVGQRALGSFYNSDFGDNDKNTYVDHDVTVYGFKDGTIDYDATEDASGESSLLLTSNIYVY